VPGKRFGTVWYRLVISARSCRLQQLLYRQDAKMIIKEMLSDHDEARLIKGLTTTGKFI